MIQNEFIRYVCWLNSLINYWFFHIWGTLCNIVLFRIIFEQLTLLFSYVHLIYGVVWILFVRAWWYVGGTVVKWHFIIVCFQSTFCPLLLTVLWIWEDQRLILLIILELGFGSSFLSSQLRPIYCIFGSISKIITEPHLWLWWIISLWFYRW